VSLAGALHAHPHPGDDGGERGVELARAVGLADAPFDHVDDLAVVVERGVHVGRAGQFGDDGLRFGDALLTAVAFPVDLLDGFQRVAGERVAVVDQPPVLGEVASTLLVEVGQRLTLNLERCLARGQALVALRGLLAQPVLGRVDERVQVAEDVCLSQFGRDDTRRAHAGALVSVAAGVVALAAPVRGRVERRAALAAEPDGAQ
jgi:hypothetical protein